MQCIVIWYKKGSLNETSTWGTTKFDDKQSFFLLEVCVQRNAKWQVCPNNWQRWMNSWYKKIYLEGWNWIIVIEYATTLKIETCNSNNFQEYLHSYNCAF